MTTMPLASWFQTSLPPEHSVNATFFRTDQNTSEHFVVFIDAVVLMFHKKGVFACL